MQDKIFANGEIVFDGDKGIGRIPGHAFTSAIVGGRIIANEIAKTEFEVVQDTTSFEIEKKISPNDEQNYERTKEKYNSLRKKVEASFGTKNGNIELENEIKQTLEEIYHDLRSVKELMIFYRISLLYEILKDLNQKRK